MKVLRGVLSLIATITIKISVYLKGALNYTSVKFWVKVKRNKLYEMYCVATLFKSFYLTVRFN